LISAILACGAVFEFFAIACFGADVAAGSAGFLMEAAVPAPVVVRNTG
jgi:hypothetical protein